MKWLSTIFVLQFAAPALACSCSQLTTCEIVRAPVVFIGELIEGGVTSLTDDPWHSNATHARFRVLENFRGLAAGTKTVDIQLMLWSGMCSPIPYYPGRRYLVMPNQRDGKLFDGVCFSGRDVERAADEVKYVRRYFGGTMPSNIYGQIAIAEDSGSVDFLLGQGETKPASRVRVYASRGGQIYSAITDDEGRYFLELPDSGRFSLRAYLPPYVAEPPKEISVGNGCTVRNFALSTDNSITGRVWDERGQPVEHALVGLIDLDRPQPKSANHAWFEHAYTKSDGTYQLKNVPLGRFVVMYNPDGPQSGALFDMPFESTYYPRGSNRETAQVIEIKSDHVRMSGMDLSLGTRVSFRQVQVKVRFPDGTPMKTASVACTGAPSRIGDPIWTHRKVAMGSGSVQFPAPANRRLRIEVQDWYGRDLRATYFSTHEPGPDSIVQEFVIKP